MAKKPKKAKQDKKLKKKKKKAEQAVDIARLGSPNLNYLPVLAGDFPDSEIVEADIFPPDPLDDITPKELFDSHSKFWELLDKARNRFPLLALRLSATADTHETLTMAFIDKGYGCKHPPVAGLSPPTWMDPEIFVRMLLADADVIAAAEAVIKDKSFAKLSKLIEEVEKVFATTYADYISNQFAAVAPLLAKWTVARLLWVAEDNKKSAKAAK